MTYSEHHLGKSVERLNVADDIEPFLRRELPEGQNLEYKSGGQLSDHGDVVSAFLNSGGGLLIVGTPAEEDIALPGNRNGKVCRGPMRPIPTVSKDDARRALLSKVTPIPANLLISSMPHAGGSVLAVDVEASNYPPHQHDGSYWIRLDGETRRAPHAFVESLFLQRRGPNLECTLSVIRGRAVDSPDALDRWELVLRLLLMNNSRNIAEYCALDLKNDPTMTADHEDGLHPNDPQQGDMVLPGVRDEGGNSLFRFRIRSGVLHAYEWKAFTMRYQIARTYDQGRRLSMKVDLQAKDMLRRRYIYDFDLATVRRDLIIHPTSVDTVTGVIL